MKIVNFGDNSTEKIVLLLGYFDGVHKGHLSLFEKAKSACESLGAKLAVFTFDDNFSEVVKEDKCIFTLSERLQIFEKCGAEIVILAKSEPDVLGLSKMDFLDKLSKNCNLQAVVCGEDYSFGRKGEGGSFDLAFYSLNCGIKCFIMPKVMHGDCKISSTLIKENLEKGKMEEVTELLGYDYFTQGEVIHGVHIGDKMGFPTLNIEFPSCKKMLRCGVYQTWTEIDGKIYNSITNFGTQPTFDRYNFVIETHVLNFSDDVYGKTVRVHFRKFVRGLIKFNSIEDLKMQIKEDLKVYD